MVVVADSGFSALELIAAVHRYFCFITRLRLDASLFEPAPKRRKGQLGRPALKGKRRPKLNAVLTDPKTVWTSVLLTEWYGGQTRKLDMSAEPPSGITTACPRLRSVGCWCAIRPASVTRRRFFAPTSASNPPRSSSASCAVGGSRQPLRGTRTLGVETQRQWSDLAILRTTPALLGLYSLVTVWAQGLTQYPSTLVRPHPAAWYNKRQPTFSDAIAAVRRVLWSPAEFFHIPVGLRSTEIPVTLLNQFVETYVSPPEMRKAELKGQ